MSHALRTVRAMKCFLLIDPVSLEPLAVWAHSPRGVLDAHLAATLDDPSKLTTIAERLDEPDVDWRALAMFDVYPVESSYSTAADAFAEWGGNGIPDVVRALAGSSALVAADVSGAELSESVGGPAWPFVTEQKLSTLCEFFADESRMTVVARPGIDQGGADLLLAWGLAYRGDRALSLIVPTDRAEPTLARAPWFAPKVRVFTFDGHTVREPLPLTRAESIDVYRRHRSGGQQRPVVLGDKADWIQTLLDWTANASWLDPIERGSYAAWHVGGRQVLRITTSAKQLTLVAGVDAKYPAPGRAPIRVRLTGPVEQAMQERLIATIATAAADRLAGSDAGHLEHRMQSALRPAQLGLADGWRREFPAWRPGSTRVAFVDFLATDSAGRVHVVETKIGADPMLVLQGLDYWLWCRAHHDHLAAELGATSKRSPVIRFVVAPKKPGGEPISIYTAAQAESLHREIEWRFTVVDDPATATHVQPWPAYHLPEPHRRAGRTPPRWAVRLHRHAISAATDAGVVLHRTHTYPNLEASLLPAAHLAYQRLADRGLVHDHIGHVRSSQAFALNLLAPLTAQAWTSIARWHLDDPDAVVELPIEFEYVDARDDLGEATMASPHSTQVDCLVRVNRGDGRRHLLLIEVKLSEDSFSTCSAATSPNNDRRHLCAVAMPFGGDTAGCFQLANHDREHRRRYDIALDLPAVEPAGFGCWFRDGTNQVMRNVAIARALIARGEAESASMLLMAPDGHQTIWEQWERHIAALGGVEAVRFGALPASRVAALHGPVDARVLTARYELPADLLEVRLAQRVVDARFPDGAFLHRQHLDGDGYSQELRRLVVIAADPKTITFATDYPAGPFIHHTRRSVWEHTTGPITIADPAKNGSRTITPDLTELDPDDQRNLTEVVAAQKRAQPWWTAPVDHYV